MTDRDSSPFLAGHATHHDWRMACELALAQFEGRGPGKDQGTGKDQRLQQGQDPGKDQRLGRGPGSDQRPGTGETPPLPEGADDWLGWVYMTTPMAAHAGALLNHLIQRTGIRNWTGCCSDRVLAGSAEYANEPAIALMLGRLPPRSFRLFSGRRSEAAATGEKGSRWLQVHADPQLADLDELLDDLARRHGARNCFGGITSGFESAIPQVAGELLEGGLSGVVFSDNVGAHLGFTQGCAPIGTGHRVTRSDRHLIREIDDRPALDVLLDELGMPSGVRRPRNGRDIMASMPKERLRGGLLVELGEPPAAPGEVATAWVRNLLGIDTVDGCIAIAGQATEGAALRFCTRDAGSARADLIRMCTQIRESVEERGERLRGAVYVSCLARGEHLFGRSGIETEWVQHYLGAPALVGFHANGEIHANRLHAYSAVLMAFS